MSRFFDVWLIGEDAEDAVSNFPYLTREAAQKDADGMWDMNVYEARVEIHLDTVKPVA